jgi:hypothetical protein
MTYLDLHRKMNDQPFKPFRIRLVNHSTIDVHEPGMMVIGKTSAIVATQTARDEVGVRYALDWKTISISQIFEFSDLKSKGNGSTRKR